MKTFYDVTGKPVLSEIERYNLPGGRTILETTTENADFILNKIGIELLQFSPETIAEREGE